MKKYEQVYEKLRNDILEGYLKNHQQLPSIRQSCQIFKVSQTTIQHAYDQLLLEGYIVNKPQVGYFVDIQDERIQLHKKIDTYKNTHEEINYLYDLRSQTVSHDSFETRLWKRYLRDVLDNTENMSTYGDSQGEYELREALAQYAYKMRSVLCDPHHILIGSNFQSLLFILVGLMPQHFVIGMEKHENSQIKRALQSHNHQVVTIKSLEDGIDIDDLKNYHIDVLYINTSSQGLKKKPISHKLRNQLLSYTSRHHILVIEDDYNGELTYQSKNRYSIQGISYSDNVIYCGSFSRLLLPSFRISYMVLNDEFYHIYQAVKNEYGSTTSKLEQLAFSRYIVDGYLVKHVKRLKKLYKKKSDIMKQCLEKYIPYPLYLNEAYLCYYIELHEVDEKKIESECQKRKIAINSIQDHKLEVSFASISIDQIEDVIKKLSQIINQSMKL